MQRLTHGLFANNNLLTTTRLGSLPPKALILQMSYLCVDDIERLKDQLPTSLVNVLYHNKIQNMFPADYEKCAAVYEEMPVKSPTYWRAQFWKILHGKTDKTKNDPLTTRDQSLILMALEGRTKKLLEEIKFEDIWTYAHILFSYPLLTVLHTKRHEQQVKKTIPITSTEPTYQDVFDKIYQLAEIYISRSPVTIIGKTVKTLSHVSFTLELITTLLSHDEQLLFAAVLTNQSQDIINNLLDRNIPIKTLETVLRQSPLWFAAKFNCVTAATALLKRGANTSFVYEGFNHLRCLIADPNQMRFDRPLYIAARAGHTEVIAELINAGVNIKEGKDYNDNGGCHTISPIWTAVIHGHVEAVRLLSKHESVNYRKLETGYTVLHVAAQSGNVAMVSALLESKYIKIDVCNNDGMTPSALAVRAGHTEVVKLLIAKGANVHLQFDHNKGDRPWFMQASLLWIAIYFKHTAITSILIAHVSPEELDRIVKYFPADAKDWIRNSTVVDIAEGDIKRALLSRKRLLAFMINRPKQNDSVPGSKLTMEEELNIAMSLSLIAFAGADLAGFTEGTTLTQKTNASYELQQIYVGLTQLINPFAAVPLLQDNNDYQDDDQTPVSAARAHSLL